MVTPIIKQVGHGFNIVTMPYAYLLPYKKDLVIEILFIISWCTRYDSNVRHLVPKTSALSTELRVLAIMRQNYVFSHRAVRRNESAETGCSFS